MMHRCEKSTLIHNKCGEENLKWSRKSSNNNWLAYSIVENGDIILDN